MTIFVNGTELSFEGRTIMDLVRQLALKREGCAVAIGSRVISQAEWDSHLLTEGDRVTIIHATQGG